MRQFTATLCIVIGSILCLQALAARAQNSKTANTTLHGVSILAGDALNRKIAGVRPSAEEEGYRRIPWRTNMTMALKEAQEQKKPLFIWAMDGNPLCWT